MKINTEELKNLMKDAFYSAVRMNAWYSLGGSEEDFNEYWNKESTQKAVKNIVVLDGVSESVCDNCSDSKTGFYLGTTCPKCKKPWRIIK